MTHAGFKALSLAAGLGLGLFPGHGGPGPGAGRLPVERIAERLDLSQAQVDRLKEIDRTRVSRLAELKAREEVLRHELAELMAAQTPNRGAVFGKLDELAALHGEALKARFAARIEAKALLGDKAEALERWAGPRRGAWRRGAGRGLGPGSPWTHDDETPAPEPQP